MRKKIQRDGQKCLRVGNQPLPSANIKGKLNIILRRWSDLHFYLFSQKYEVTLRQERTRKHRQISLFASYLHVATIDVSLSISK